MTLLKIGLFTLIAVIGIVSLAALLIYWNMRTPPLSFDPVADLEQKKARLKSWYATLCDRNLHNGTILIARNGRIILHEHCGYRDAASSRPLTDRSAFNLASVSKQFTAMGIMILAHRGKLLFDDPLQKWVPEIEAPGVTIRHLLHHTSGLADYMKLASKHWDDEKPLTFADFLKLFQQHRPPVLFRAGDKFQYSNTGYVLLGLIIERASQLPHAEFMSRNIFQPLGMSDSAAFNLLSEPDTLPERVFGFRKRFPLFGKNAPNDLNVLDGLSGDGGIYASARDLVKWEAAWRSDTLLPRENIAEAFKSGRTNEGRETRYGFGWFLDPKGTYSHTGAWAGFNSVIILEPKKRTLLVILDNSTNMLRMPSIVNTLERFTETLPCDDRCQEKQVK